MTVILNNDTSYFLAAPARLVGEDRRDMAWAEKIANRNPALAWVLAKYVEADKANSNGQYWTLGDLRIARPTIDYSPMNMLHDPRAIRGAWVANELVYPIDGADWNGVTFNPYIETLGAYWKYYYPDDFTRVKAAYDSGSLFVSMECVSETVTCAGDLGCGTSFAYDGPDSITYCAHLQDHKSIRQMDKPHFLGGALIFPPARPGWQQAEVKDLSALVKQYQVEAAAAYEQVEAETPHLGATEWEQLMGALLQHAEEAKNYKMATRKKMAKTGSAMGDGSFPIADEKDLHNAIKLAGQAKNPIAARTHIKKRAKVMGLEKLIPPTWK